MEKRFSQIWEYIADDLKETITHGELKPGQRLKIEEITARYGVSNTPVREAFRYLASQGFVQNIPRKKVIVKEVTLRDIENIYAIHTVLEGLAAKLTAQNCNEKELNKLEKVYRRMEKYLREGSVSKYMQADKEFHGFFIHSSGNDILISMAENLGSRIERFRFMTLRFPRRAKESLNEHRKILDALKGHEPEVAEKEVKSHILISSEYLKKLLKEADSLDYVPEARV
jgi:DNA-binding GntR family transcriptional regulator